MNTQTLDVFDPETCQTLLENSSEPADDGEQGGETRSGKQSACQQDQPEIAGHTPLAHGDGQVVRVEEQIRRRNRGASALLRYRDGFCADPLG